MKTVELIRGRRRKVVFVPTGYNEMTEKHFVAALKLSEKQIKEERFWQEWGINSRWFNSLPADARIELSKIVEYLADVADQQTDRFFIETVRFLRSPSRRLEGMSMQQFMAVDSYFSYYCCTNKEEFLAKMLAATYLRKGEGFVKDAEHRRLVNIEKRTRIFSKQKHRLLRKSIYVTWILIKNWLSKEYKYLFPRGENDEKAKPVPIDWLAIFYSFVGQNVPHMQFYQAMPCMDAFYIMNQKIKEQNERKEN